MDRLLLLSFPSVVLQRGTIILLIYLFSQIMSSKALYMILFFCLIKTYQFETLCRAANPRLSKMVRLGICRRFFLRSKHFCFKALYTNSNSKVALCLTFFLLNSFTYLGWLRKFQNIKSIINCLNLICICRLHLEDLNCNFHRLHLKQTILINFHTKIMKLCIQ